jgi:hypothetical protein
MVFSNRWNNLYFLFIACNSNVTFDDRTSLEHRRWRLSEGKRVLEKHCCLSRLGPLRALSLIEWQRALSGGRLGQLFKTLPDLHEPVASGPA